MTLRASFIRHSTAFTLVEVLATLTLMAIIMPVAMRGISLATATAGQARRQVEAVSLAESKLAELQATGEWQGGSLFGDCGTDWPDYQWDCEVSDWEGTTVQQLAVSVTWLARGAARKVTLTTLVYTGMQ